LKLNSTTVLGSSVILFDENINAPLRPTSTLVLRRPPIGRPSGGDVLVVAFEANFLNASIVLPVVGLSRTLDYIQAGRPDVTYALIA